MHRTNLRQVGGSVMLAVPPAVLDLLGLRAGSRVALAVEQGRLVVHPHERPRYTLDELLSRCSSKPRRSTQDRRWTAGERAGRELI
jgi:antitoxin ChpS